MRWIGRSGTYYSENDLIIIRRVNGKGNVERFVTENHGYMCGTKLMTCHQKVDTLE